MNYSKFVADLRDEFFRSLEMKTNWGRNDLKLEFERAITIVLAKAIEQMHKDV